MKPITTLKNYRGNKGVFGLYQFIINRIPPCEIFYEAFAGSAMISKKIGFAAATVLNDCNAGVTDILNCTYRKQATITNLPAVQLLLSLAAAGKETFVYCDPPYIMSTRGSNRKIYKYEMYEDDHAHFLSVVRTV